MKTRCGWVDSDPLYIEYHDKEWGVPSHDDQKLFEFIILEGVGAADKAAIQRVKVPPCHLLVSDT